MKFKNKGLTVGELTIGVSVILIIFFGFSSLNKNNNSNRSLNPISSTTSFSI